MPNGLKELRETGTAVQEVLQVIRTLRGKLAEGKYEEAEEEALEYAGRMCCALASGQSAPPDTPKQAIDALLIQCVKLQNERRKLLLQYGRFSVTIDGSGGYFTLWRQFLLDEVKVEAALKAKKTPSP